MTIYCKVCGSGNVQLKKIKYGTTQTEGGEISGGLPIFKSKISDSLGTIREVEGEEYCCNLCLNEGVNTNVEPVALLEEETNRKIVLIPENLNNTLSKLGITKNNLVKILEEKENQFGKILLNFVQVGRNTCKDYRVGERLSLKIPIIKELLVWVIVEMMDGSEIYRLSFGGGDIICR